MTTTTLQPDGYDPRTLPPADSGSRFALTTTPAGWGSAPDKTTTGCWEQLLADAARETAPHAPTSRAVKLWRVGRITGTASFATVERGTVTAVPTKTPTTSPQRYRARSLRGGAFLDSFLLRDPDGPWHTAKDETVFAALQEWAEETQPTQAVLNDANIIVCLAILLRHGIEARPDDIPGWPQ